MKTALSGIMFENQSIADAVKAAGEAGYDGLELRTNERHLPATTTPEKARTLRRQIEGYGMHVSCIASFVGEGAGGDQDKWAAHFEDFKRFTELAHELDCDLVRVILGGPASAVATEADWVQPVIWLKKIESFAAANGVYAVIEIHNGDLVDDVDSGIKITHEVGGQHLGLIYEPANMHICGKSYGAEAVKALAERILHVHVKDVVLHAPKEVGSQPPFEIVPLGKGEMDYLSVFRGLHEIDYNGYVCVELAHGPHIPMPPVYLAKRELMAVKYLMDLTR